jgi:ABC-type transport system involved in cytochrome bd biosynthesis fused ATPase/permease subunit
MTDINSKILKILIIVDVLVIAVSVMFFDIKVLYNTQFGFISATLVMIASMISYRRMVNTRVEHNIITIDDSKDVIDKLEDPYDLYSEEVVQEEEKDLVETVKEEKKRLKQNRRSLYQTLKDTKAALSIYRLGAYAVLVLGFLYLNRHGLFHIPSYILALSIPPVVIVVMLLQEKENHSQD